MSKIKPILNLRAGVASFALSALLMPLPAFAQGMEPDPAADDSAVIVVTGSRIVRAELDMPNPVVTISSDAIVQSGVSNLTELLSQSPALFNSLTNVDAAGSEAGHGMAGVNLLNLRNLGTQRTLVLVNGRRHVSGVAGEAAVDINTIPTSLVDRIDVLTGGVSAIYGADGVSGVVNFVMKRDFEGIDFQAQQGISGFGDAPNTYISGAAGQNFSDGRGNITVAYDFRKDGRVSYADRPIGRATAERLVRNPDADPDDPSIPGYVFLNDLRYVDSSPDGAVAVDDSLVPLFRGGGQWFDPGRPIANSSLTQGGSSTPIANYDGDLQSATEVHNVNVLTSYEFSPAMRFFAEGKYVRSTAFTVSQPSFDFYTFLPVDNAFIPAAIRDAITPGNLAYWDLDDGVVLSRDNFDLGTRNERSRRDLFRAVIGFDGALGDYWKYEVSYVFGQNKSTFRSENYRLWDRYYAAIDAVDEGALLTGTANGNIRCRVDLTGSIASRNLGDMYFFDDSPFNDVPTPQTFANGCVPLNLFGEGVRDPAALDFVNVDLVNRYRLRQQVASGYVSGDLGQLFDRSGGPVRVALGGEYRKESSRFTPDPISTRTIDDDPEISILTDLSLLAPEAGGFNVWEIFGEVNVPLLANLPFAHRLDIGGAIRLSDYSTIGTTTTWKVDGTWAPVPDIMLRGSYSEAVRAPNITELFAPQSGTYQALSDPCSPANVATKGTAFRADNCRALIEGLGVDFDAFDYDNSPLASATIRGRATGNNGLREEKARTWTAGTVLRPTAVPGLAVTFDWYDIRLTNAVNTASLQETAEFCVDSATLDNVFCQNITRDRGTGYVTNYLLRPENVAFFETAGADMTVGYAFQPSTWGRFNVRGTLGYLSKLNFLPANGGIVDVDRGEAGAPKWVGTADLTWTKDNVLINYGLNYVGKQRRFEYSETQNNPNIVDPHYLYYKSGLTHDIRFEVTTTDRKAGFYIGANNFTNAKPDRGSANTPVSFLGRYFYVGTRISLDKIRL